ncbi:MAG: DUF6273 domain-containing protein [Acutalibacteraceae bacterium]
MQKNLKRILACVMVVIMTLTAVPLSGLTVFAEETTGKKITDYKMGDIIEFGYYPQSKVTDESLISDLNKQDGTWVSYGYYMEGYPSDYTKYKDVVYKGERYRSVTFTSYRPMWSDCFFASDEYCQYDNGYLTGVTYWFKYEPLTWRVLNPSTGLVMCTSIIDSQEFNPNVITKTNNGKTIYANNWKYSSIRTWLNNSFYNLAFTSEHKAAISTTTIQNPAYSTSYSKYNANATNDKIYLLSYTDAQNTAYGFASGTGTSSTRQFKGTDYAKAQGLWVSESSGGSAWRLRTAGYNDDDCGEFLTFSCAVGGDGQVSHYDETVCSTAEGIIPSFNFSLNAEINQCNSCLYFNLNHNYSSVVTQPTHLENGYITYTCKRCNYKYIDYPEILKAEGHLSSSPVKEKVIKATCTKNGSYNEVTYCAVCNEELSNVKRTESKLGHSYGKYVFNNDATFTSDGTKTATCIRCGAKKTIKIDDYELKGRCGETLAYKFKVDSQKLVIDGKGHFYTNGKTVLTNAENKRYKDKCSNINTSCDKTIDSYNSRISQLESEGYFTGTYTEFRNVVNDLTTKISNLDRRIASIGGSSDPSEIAEKRRLESERNKYQSQLDDLYKMYSNASQINAFREQIKFTESSRTNDLQKQKEVHSQNIKKISEYISAYGYSHLFVTNTTKATLTKNGSIVKKCTSKKCDYCKTTTIYKASSIKLSKTSFTYNGKAQKPTVTVKNSKGTALKNGTDYTLSYSSGCKNTGKYSVKITFKGNYSGSKTLYFNILPSKTSSLTASQTTTSIKATWKAVTGASGYKVTLYTSKDKVVKTIDTTKTTYTFSKLSKGTTYKVRVTAYKTIDSKKVSSSIYTQLTTATKTDAPSIKVSSSAKKTVKVSWSKVTGATEYTVYYSTSKNGTYKKLGSTIGTSYTYNKLSSGKTYYFKVIANKKVGRTTINSAYSAVKSVKVK